MIFSWLASLGLASKLAVGAGAVAVGVAGGGAAGVLPPVAQEAFDEVVAIAGTDAPAPVEEAPVEEAPVEDAPVDEVPAEGSPVVDAPAEELPAEELPAEESPVEEAPDENAGELDDRTTHGDRVSAVAKNKALHGREHGKAVSAAAHDKAGKQATPEQEPAEDDADELEDADDAKPVDAKPAKKGKVKDKRSR